jgi:DNA-binding PadR family transcriptional regulator
MAQATHPSVEQMLPLTPAVFHILIALEGKPKHGYGIMKTVEEITGGKASMGPGTLYGTIKRLLKAGLIEETEEQPDPDLDDERRRYYRLTSLGKRVLHAEVKRIDNLMKVARAKNLLEEAA